MIAFDFNNGEKISEVSFEGIEYAIHNVAVKWPFVAVVAGTNEYTIPTDGILNDNVKIFNMENQSFIRHIENGGYELNMQGNVFTTYHYRNQGLFKIFL